jgi:4-oxalocrotonate tautomerase
MPLVRISVLRGRAAQARRRLGDAVHAALVETVGVPALDRFQIITEHAAEDLAYDPSYLGIRRTDGIVMVQITFSGGRSTQQKRSLYRAIADNLAREGVRPEDVWVNLVEVPRENWSFGNGLASYAPAEQAA